MDLSDSAGLMANEYKALRCSVFIGFRFDAVHLRNYALGCRLIENLRRRLSPKMVAAIVVYVIDAYQCVQ